MNKIGFYGGGNMGKAIIGGLIESKLFKPEDIYVYDVYEPTLIKLKEEFGINPISDKIELASQVNIILLSVKPNVLPELVKEIKDNISKDKILISIAAGITQGDLTSLLSDEHKIVRVMPNTPALVGEGMSAVSPNANLNKDELELVGDIFASFGKAEFVDEKLIDAVVGVSGSAPAYVYMFIEALADGAVLEGMPRNQAYEFASQAVLGSAKMVLETGKHPGELKDQVCSPGGTTIAAVKALEDFGFRSAVIEAVQVAAEKNRTM